MLGEGRLASTGTTCVTTDLRCGPTGWLDCMFMAGLLRKPGWCSLVLAKHLPQRPLAETMCATLQKRKILQHSLWPLVLRSKFAALKKRYRFENNRKYQAFITGLMQAPCVARRHRPGIGTV